ncbi:MAG: DoxX family protein, partial [Dysgonamonadaceae bacterium]|nr:DoxX family protein [Dysgonamonadaceae bacterium]
MNLKKKTVLIEICRLLLGAALVLSGFFKAIDPWGSAYKIDEYLGAFGLRHLTALDLGFSFIQIAVEFTVGACLLLGIYRKRTTLLALVIMLFMTPLTLYLAFKNPISDCGCFGDALIISNWLTFLKNVILLATAVYLFQHKKSLAQLFSRQKYFVTFLWTLFFIVGFSAYSCTNLPIVDFRPYKIGTNIKEKMKIPDDAEQSKYETTLVYSKNGVSKEFNINNYPKDDSTWTFVDSRNRLVKKGYVPPIHDFTITDVMGEDITDAILDNLSYTFLLISSNIENAKDNNISLINDIYDYARLNEYGFYALT